MQSILITGGTGKLGRVFVQYFAEKGWQVVFTATNSERSVKLEKELAGAPGSVLGVTVDLTRANSARDLVDILSEKGLSPEHLVNNARSLKSLDVGVDGFTRREDFAAEFLLDVIVPYELTVALSQQENSALRTVVNIGSQYGSVATNPWLYEGDSSKTPIQYGVAKAALSHLTRELAVRLAEDDIRVNCVAYGGIEGRVDSAFKERYEQLAPMGRMLSEDDLAGPLEFLVSDQSGAMTGQTLMADGGWTIW